MTNKSLLIAFFAGVAVTFGFHVLETSKVYPKASPQLLKYCTAGKFHPDCRK